MEATAPRTVTLPCAFCRKANRVDLARAAQRPKCAACGRPFLLDRPVKLDDETFDRVLRDAAVPVLVDFYADWCGPCKMMAPVLDELARDRVGEVLVAKLDTDRSQRVAQRFGIASIPTLIVFRDGREVRRQLGAVARPHLDALLQAA